MIRIGFDATAKGGPGIFLGRLRAALDEMGAFSLEWPDVWLQLSHKPFPEAMQKPDRPCRLMVRTAGGYYNRYYFIKKPVVLPLPLVDTWYSRRKNEKLNAPIREALLRADGIVFQSAFTRQMVQHFITSTPLGTIILNGVDTRLFAPEPGRRRADKGLNILVAHQFRLHKRLHDVIRTVARIRECLLQREPVTLHVLGGDGRQAFHYAHQAIRETGMSEHVKFWGLQPSEKLPEFYAQYDFMLALPLWDPCPNSVIEALSCGLPVVTTEAGGIPEIIGNAGRVIPETVPLRYTDHYRYEALPRVNIEQAVQASLQVIDQLEDFRVLARERAVSALDIREIARQYLEAATILFDV